VFVEKDKAEEKGKVWFYAHMYRSCVSGRLCAGHMCGVAAVLVEQGKAEERLNAGPGAEVSVLCCGTSW
jgi:hypothetical protein